ncbi:Rne/Rng family ribonuclease [Corynebacterium uberis]|uniref:Rne/Rng family ribonuclease n=1 Tax=Corynebacterium TaxID=1716 RepID=UPI001D0B52A2|nr:Rne/Rng family ribonuclease [Corynebacterium uberis]MCZ9310066.1 Rne/Rng family ribonuclease [Corynebacterium sp. c6VSa_13]UDL75304.1 Rne/Rng family ribonuclease [Corynebacterium uberis]UDL77515.1 Rne/Rng family ribonuclease [Corynebacterium uberis]UDL79802.1 Rne/Rng family ribonuclease [Corynebacterium uberis]UDL84142.1 Rne/Rng family ribonuclease [Corynebacterium uberis]
MATPAKTTASTALKEAADSFDRDQLVPKMRLHLLAKGMGVTSKELIGAAAELGWKKVAQSTLSIAESQQLLDFLSAADGQGAQETQQAQPDAAKEAASEEAPQQTPAKKKTTAKKTAAKKATAKKATAKKATAKKAPAKKTAAKKPVEHTPDNAEQSPQDTTPATDQANEQAPAAEQAAAKKTTAKKTSAKKATAKKATAKKTAAKKAPAKTTSEPEEPQAAPETPAAAQSDSATADATPQRRTKRRRATRKSGPEKSGQEQASPASPKEDAAAEKPADDAAETASDQATESVRRRVRANVDNEIAQIEQKVDAQLAQDLAQQDNHDNQDNQDNQDTDAPEAQETEPSEQAGASTSAPAPLFLPPHEQEEQDSARPAKTKKAQRSAQAAPSDDAAAATDDAEDAESAGGRRARRRGRRGAGRGRGGAEASISTQDAQPDADEPAEEEQDTPAQDLPQEPTALRGSTRLEAQRRRRTERREEDRKNRHLISQAEFLARRESVTRTMVVRERERTDHPGMVTQVAVLEDDLLVEHFVTSDAQTSLIGNIYLGRVQNVLPSMEAAFIDIGKGRNGVLYAGEVDWKAAGAAGRERKIERALHSGDQVLVQVTKDPIGHKGARLTTQISLAGRYLVYVPGGRSAGISRKLPVPERKRLKDILKKVVPNKSGAIIRTAAEGASEEAIATDVHRLHDLWEDIQERADKEKKSKGAKPRTLYEEPEVLVKVVRDLFNEDFTNLIVDGRRAWNTVDAYVRSVAPDLADRLVHFDRDAHDGQDAFARYRVDEQLDKALSRMVWLPSGGSLVIDRTEAMTVIDVNTGKFTGSGGNLEETVTRNNLEAAEEIVRQLRLRDIGGMIVIDFIDMVLPENQDLVLRRLTEALSRDRTRHQVSEVTSLGLVQLTRKRLGTGLLETFSTPCEACGGRGIIIHTDPVEEPVEAEPRRGRGGASSTKREAKDSHPAPKHSRRAGTAPSSDEELEKLAAAVVIEDPTSGEDAHPQQHVAEEQESASARRRRRRRVQTAAAREQAGQHDTEQDQHAQDSAAGEERDQAHEPATTGRGRRRRATRGDSAGARRRHATEKTEQLSEVERIAAEAVDSASIQDPDEPSGADYVPAAGADTYEEALARFEASPRRKRRTRGNSTSDHRPRRSDFAQPASEQEHSSRDDAPSERPARSRRRRSAQDSTASRSTGRRSKAAGGYDQYADRSERAEVPEEQPARRVAIASADRERAAHRRPRRRAVRGVRPQEAQQQRRQDPPKQEAQPEKKSAGAQQEAAAPRRRGRRRATRS